MAPGCKECLISVYSRLKKVNKHFYEKEVNMKMGGTENVQVRKELLPWECSSKETYWNGKVDGHINFPFHTTSGAPSLLSSLVTLPSTDTYTCTACAYRSPYRSYLKFWSQWNCDSTTLWESG